MGWQGIKEARYRLSREKGAVFKDWGGRTSVALVYPNSYYVGMSNLGFQTIYALLNCFEDIVCERAFHDWGPGDRVRIPLSLESQRPLGDFDLLAFSVSYELDYFNVVHALRAAGIPPLAEEREERHPLVIAGGPCVTANPEPLAPFCDLLVIGEGEPVLPELVGVLRQGIGTGRAELLEEEARVPGVYVPTLGNRAARRWALDLEGFATTSTVLTPDTELGEMFLLEVARGCGRGCRFCLAGYAFRPPRARSVEALVEQAKGGLERVRRLGLVGAAAGDHPELEELIGELRGLGAELSVSSLRADRPSEVLLEALAASGTRTVTLAPEAGSERLRRVINKDICEEDVLRWVALAAGRGMGQVKLYFMVGLPTETEADVQALAQLVLKARGQMEGSSTRLVVSLAPFVPKAGTPFQWLPMAPAEVLSRRLRLIKGMLAGRGVAVRAESVGWSLAQGVLSRGHRRVGQALLEVEERTLSGWRRSLERCGLSEESLACAELTLDAELPWATAGSGVSPEHLAQELGQARLGKETPACPPAGCTRCGVC